MVSWRTNGLPFVKLTTRRYQWTGETVSNSHAKYEHNSRIANAEGKIKHDILPSGFVFRRCPRVEIGDHEIEEKFRDSKQLHGVS